LLGKKGYVVVVVVVVGTTRFYTVVQYVCSKQQTTKY